MKHEHHIIENHNGVRVRTDKTISLTLKEHADIHKKYFEQWGFKEDYLAWQGLSGQLPKEKIIHEIAVEMGKRNAHHMHTKQARKKKIKKIITFTGNDKNNNLTKLGDINFWVDSKAYNHIENVHQILLLSLVDLIIGKTEYPPN